MELIIYFAQIFHKLVPFWTLVGLIEATKEFQTQTSRKDQWSNKRIRSIPSAFLCNVESDRYRTGSSPNI